MGPNSGDPELEEFRPSPAEQAYLRLLEMLARMHEARDPYSRGHSQRVERLALLIATEMGCSAELRRALAQAARVHDVGKLAVGNGILLKGSSLDPVEWASIMKHPADGARVLRSFNAPESVASIVEGHHERYDGVGYPRGLEGEEIPLGARILAVADAYDALTSERPYRPRLTDGRAMQVLAEGAGTQWDPGVVEALTRIRKRQAVTQSRRGAKANPP